MNSSETTVLQASGLIKGFKSNKHGDIDAVNIETNKGEINLHFPPHTAKQVMDKVAVGQQIVADYTEKVKPGKKSKLELESIKEKQQNDALTITDKKLEKANADQSVETIKPETFTLVRDKKEEPVAILADNKLIHLHKDDKEIAEAIRPDSKLTIQAVLRPDEGFVNEKKLPVYHIKTIDIDGHSFQPSKKK